MIETAVNIKSKLPHFNNSIFATMTQLADKHNAINLSQGFPDFNCSAELAKLVNKYINNGDNQYAPMKGVESLRNILSKKYQHLHKADYHPEDEITITAGATQAIFSAITAFVHEDDEVIIIEPSFDTYAPSVMYNGGVIKYSVTYPPDFTINWEQTRRLISSRTKMIILNFPNNPTGKNIREYDLQQLSNLVANTDIIIMSDEVYEHILFDNQQHLSLSSDKELAKRSLIISSFGKTYSITGWKLGYCLAPEKLTHEFRKAHQNIVFAANHPMQKALTEYIKNNGYGDSYNKFYQQKRDYFLSLMSSSRFRMIPSEGTFYQLADFGKISEQTDLDFAKTLTTKHKVAAIPLSAFYHNNINHQIVRFCFAKSDDTLKKATDILCKI
ncbi:MAG: methionine aminotransferase [Bacteroidota bacterium]